MSAFRIRRKKALSQARTRRKLQPTAERTTLAASPARPLSQHRPRWPSLFMCPITASMAERRLSSRLMTSNTPRFWPEMNMRRGAFAPGSWAPEEIETRRKAFIRKWRLKHRPVVEHFSTISAQLISRLRLRPAAYPAPRFEAPLVRVIALYSNVLEDPGVIASPEIGTSQLDFLKAALTR